MKKVLGLDLGVSSIGWAFIERDSNKKIGRIVDAGVRIVPLSTDEATEFTRGSAISTNRERTMKRGARRNNQRFKLRRQRLLNILTQLGWINSKTPLQTDDSLELYGNRSKAVEERLEREELARVFLSLNNKRGYQSNRKAQNEDEDGTDYLEQIRERDNELLERNITIGQKHLELLLDNRWAELKRRIYSRKTYRKEFERIWETQKAFYPEMTDQLKLEIGDRTIYYQRPLRSQKGLISKCTLEPLKRVSPKSSPVFQMFKIWQQIHNLEINDDRGTTYLLDLDQKKALFEVLDSKGKMTLPQFKKLMGFGMKDPIQINFPYLEGNYTRSALLKIFQDTGYDTHEILELDLSIQGNDFDKQPYMQLWHLLYSSTDQECLIENLKLQFNFNNDQAKAIAKVKLVQDYGSLSVRAMRKMLPFLQEGHTYTESAVYAKYRHSLHETLEESNNRNLEDKLPVITKGKLRNPVVEKILNQLVHVINDIIDHPELGRPDEIRVELARELKASAKNRQETTKRINRDTHENERIRKLLVEDYRLPQVSRNDILKWKLYEEAGGKSMYTGQPLSPHKLFNTDEYDIDHIIPQSRLFDDSASNKILCESWINREKGNMTAWDYIQLKGESETRRFLQDIQDNSKISLAKKLKMRMSTQDIPQDFISRQLKESQYIVKHALSMLRTVCREVTSTSGSITSYLRNEWGLAHVMQELNLERYKAQGKVTYRELQGGKKVPKIADWTKRDDHRHHAVDAIVVACTSQGIIQKLNNLNQRFDGLINIHKDSLKFELPWSSFRQDAINALSNVLISFKGKNKVATLNRNKTKIKGKGNYRYQQVLTPRGQLHKETVYRQMRHYEPHPIPLSKKFNRPDLIIDPNVREIVTERWSQYGNDPIKAAASLKTNPINHSGVFLTEVRCWREQFTIRKPITPDIKLEKVLDRTVYGILLERLSAFDGDKKKAFGNLPENPIWFNKEKSISIKSVRLEDNGDLTPLHHNGVRPIDFVYTRNNHHAAIFKGPEGQRSIELISFFEAVERQRLGLPIYSTNNAEQWPLEFSLQKNDYFLFDIDPEEVDLYDPKNRNLISKQLFRVQKISAETNGGFDFVFRHHMETNVDKKDDQSFKRIRSFGKLTGFKVRLNRLGHIF